MAVGAGVGIVTDAGVQWWLRRDSAERAARSELRRAGLGVVVFGGLATLFALTRDFF